MKPKVMVILVGLCALLVGVTAIGLVNRRGPRPGLSGSRVVITSDGKVMPEPNPNLWVATFTAKTTNTFSSSNAVSAKK